MNERYGIKYTTEKLSQGTTQVRGQGFLGVIQVGTKDGYRTVQWSVWDSETNGQIAKSIPGNEFNWSYAMALDDILYAVAHRND